MPRLGQLVAAQPVSPRRAPGPVYTGPSGEGKNAGVTQGLLSRYLACPERCRLYLVDGLRAAERFSYPLHFGSAWHEMERALAAGHGHPGAEWQDALDRYCQGLYRSYPLQRPDVEKLYAAASCAFPVYVDFWAKHPDAVGRTPLFQEQVFDVPYALPSGRTVRLRGRWDGGDLLSGENEGVWLFETKTKSNVDEARLQRQLLFDLQTMTYLVALREKPSCDLPRQNHYRASNGKEHLIRGVRYNVVRRPLSGGKGSIVRHQATKGAKCQKCKGSGVWPEPRTGVAESGLSCPKCHGSGRTGGKPEETWDEYYTRLRNVIAAEPHEFFYRWNVTVTPGDVARFEREFLQPCLENLCDDWEWWRYCKDDPDGVDEDDVEPMVYDYGYRAEVFPGHRRRHFRRPYGGYDPLERGVDGDLDYFLATGNQVGLSQTEVLFPELEGGDSDGQGILRA